MQIVLIIFLDITRTRVPVDTVHVLYVYVNNFKTKMCEAVHCVQRKET
jgi:hypothetical protein